MSKVWFITISSTAALTGLSSAWKAGCSRYRLRLSRLADAVATAEQVAATLQQQTGAYRELSSSLAYDSA
jgi:hypothetical protein